MLNRARWQRPRSPRIDLNAQAKMASEMLSTEHVRHVPELFASDRFRSALRDAALW